MAHATNAAIVTRANAELINSFLLADLGRYLFKLMFNPSRVKLLNNVMIEMSVVAIPTSVVLYTLATTIQKINPNPPMMNVLDILKMEFL